MSEENLVIISAYAKLPANITVEEVYKTVVLAAVVDMDTGTIREAEVSLITDVSKRFVANMLVGYPMDQGPVPLLDRFEKTYYGHSKKALESAIRLLFKKYEEIKRQG